jgi:hypothetical protein
MIRAANPSKLNARVVAPSRERASSSARIPFAGWLWAASGLPVGLALIAAPPPVWIAFFTFAVFLEIGHALSPIVFAWTTAAYRQQILRHRRQYVVVPTAFFLGALAIGAMTSLGWTSFVRPAHDLTGQSYAFTDLRNPCGMMVSFYWCWNIYHFGMQNFGVLALCRARPRPAPRHTLLRLGDRTIAWPRPAALLCVALTAFAMVVVPKLPHSAELGIVVYAMVFVNHWVVAIGLPSRVVGALAPTRPWLRAGGFALGVLLLGGIGFVWTAPAWLWRAWGYTIAAREPDYILISHVIPVVLAMRYGLSFVHFLYDRLVWKMSDPEVRAIIAPALAASPR